jgi:hypothetical protein
VNGNGRQPAYNDTSTITAIKSFEVPIPSVNVIKPLFFATNVWAKKLGCFAMPLFLG